MTPPQSHRPPVGSPRTRLLPAGQGSTQRRVADAPLIVALNPSVDVEWEVDDVQWGEKNEVRSERRWPGGKGVNVARWLQHLGECPRLLLPLGGRHGEEILAGLKTSGTSVVRVPIQGSTRANVIVTGASRGQLRFNPPGPVISADEWRALKVAIRKHLRTSSLLILSGSLPRGMPVSAYAELIAIAHDVGGRTLLDCEGAALAAAIPAKPFLIKPNHFELAHWARRAFRCPADIEEAALALSRRTKGWVFVSTGPQGAILVNQAAKIALAARPPVAKLKILNTVGAGDALLAAVAARIQSGQSPEDWLRWGIAVGTAATTQKAGELPVTSILPALVRRVRIRRCRAQIG